MFLQHFRNKKQKGGSNQLKKGSKDSGWIYVLNKLKQNSLLDLGVIATTVEGIQCAYVFLKSNPNIHTFRYADDTKDTGAELQRTTLWALVINCSENVVLYDVDNDMTDTYHNEINSALERRKISYDEFDGGHACGNVNVPKISVKGWDENDKK